MRLETGKIYEVTWPDSSKRLVLVLGPVEYLDVGMGFSSDVDIRLLANVDVLASAVVNPSFKGVSVTGIRSYLFWELEKEKGYTAVEVSSKDLPLYVSWPWKSLKFDEMIGKGIQNG